MKNNDEHIEVPPGALTHTGAGLQSAWNRRGFLKVQGRLAAGLLVGSLLGMTGLSRLAKAVDWQKVIKHPGKGLAGKVTKLEGEAWAGKRKLAVGDTLDNGESIRLSSAGKVVLTLADRSVVQLASGAEAAFKVSARGGGVMSLLRGVMVAVIPTGNYYAVQGHTATLGIKGTVFYREVRPAAGSNSKTNNNHTPQEYICLCHGEADYMDPDSLAVMMRRETAIHHKAVLASKTKHIQLQDAGMENHTDQEIHDLIQLQSQPRHDESWLKR